MTQTPNKTAESETAPGLRDRVVSLLAVGTIKLLGFLPYRWRLPVGGWVVSHIASPIIGYRKRIRENLSFVFPEMSQAEKTRMSRAVPAQIGRTLVELFSPEDFKKIAAQAPMTGEGVAALDAARKAGQPVILVSGHFGNYDAVRSALIQQGFNVGGLYRSMNLKGFNDFYVSRISQIGQPLFLRGQRGMGEMVRFLKGGNTIALLIDQHMGAGAPLSFFGKTASTALSAADMALRYDALLVPCYGVRRADGMHFDVIIEAPVPHTTPEEMTQALNDSLEAQVRDHMDQWLWIHRRWKAEAIQTGTAL